MYIRNPRIIALLLFTLYFETCFQKIRIFQKWGWDGIQKWDGMEFYANNSMKQVDYFDECF